MEKDKVLKKEGRKSIPVSGDLRNIYRSKTSTIPEVTPENIFSVSDSTEAMILDDDRRLIDGAQMHLEWLEKRGEIENSYFIIDIGAAHLPGVALLLSTYGVDCSFVIPEERHSRMKETLKYWGADYEAVKSSINNPKSFATLIDCHRDYKLDTKDFPSTEKLKGLGIKRVFLLKEAKVGKFDLQDEPTINQYSKSCY